MDLQIVAFYFFAHEVLKASHLSDIPKQLAEFPILQVVSVYN